VTTFGEAVLALRTARSLSQSQLADLAGLSKSYVAMIEGGSRAGQPSRHIVRALADALGVKERALLERAGLELYGELQPVLTVREAIDADPYLHPREKKALRDLYGAMVWGRR
jgi:transcriptional regulator with XRE-family HTH domain